MRPVYCFVVALFLAGLGYAVEKATIPSGSKVYVAPMEGFETYLAAALQKKNVPVTVVKDKEQADFEITGTAESEKPGWARVIFTGQHGSNEEASISVIEIKSGTVVFAYAVNKHNSARGKQSAAESCAKHLKEKVAR